MGDELKDLPIVDAAGPFPGSWSKRDDLPGTVWVGQSGWLTKHGPSTIRWLLGKPVAAYHVSMADGVVVERCETFSPADQTYWRRPAPDGNGYETGLLTIEADVVSFAPAPIPHDDDERSTFEAAIIAHPGVAEAFADMGFASAFNDYLRNQGFRKDGTEDQASSMSFRYIGGLVAELRGIGESYIDFYLDSEPFTQADTANVEAFIAELGWHRLSRDEIDVDHDKAIALLEAVEARPENSVPESDRINLRTDRHRVARPQSFTGRMHLASIDGKATREEHMAFFGLLDHDKNEMTIDEITALLAPHLKPGPFH